MNRRRRGGCGDVIMLRSYLKPLVVAGLILTLATASTGCKPWKYGIGFFAGLATMSEFSFSNVEQVCYRNGVRVDCSEIEGS